MVAFSWRKTLKVGKPSTLISKSWKIPPENFVLSSYPPETPIVKEELVEDKSEENSADLVHEVKKSDKYSTTNDSLLVCRRNLYVVIKAISEKTSKGANFFFCTL